MHNGLLNDQITEICAQLPLPSGYSHVEDHVVVTKHPATGAGWLQIRHAGLPCTQARPPLYAYGDTLR